MDRAAYFDQLAPEWDARATAAMVARLREFVQRAHLPRGGRVLDVGVGTGVLLPLLRQALGPAGRIVAVDISAEMLRVAQSRHGAPGTCFVCGDAATLAEPACSFDAVICNSVIPHFDDLPAALRHLAGLLRPGGVFIVSHATPRERVNAIHQAGPPAIQRDRLLPGETVAALLRATGLEVDCVEDTADYYFIRARAPQSRCC